jgi:hypothetical protein
MSFKRSWLADRGYADLREGRLDEVGRIQVIETKDGQVWHLRSEVDYH